MRGKVTEEQIEAARVAVYEAGGDPIPEDLYPIIYLAMRAKEAPCPDDVAKALEEAALGFDKHARLWRASAERTCLIEDRLRAENAEALAERTRAALSSIQGVRTSSGTDGGERQHG